MSAEITIQFLEEHQDSNPAAKWIIEHNRAMILRYDMLVPTIKFYTLRTGSNSYSMVDLDFLQIEWGNLLTLINIVKDEPKINAGYASASEV